MLDQQRWIVCLAQRYSSASLRDDVAQETWVQFLERPPRDRRAVFGWLKQVVKHTATRLGRRERERGRNESEAAIPDPSQGPEEDPERAAFLERLPSLVHALDEPYRTVIRMRYLEELTTKEIAQGLGRPHATVRSQVKRGLYRLRVCGTPPGP